MSKRVFTKGQIQELLKNESVSRCSSKSITYSNSFKIKAIKQYDEHGLTSREIFKQAGLDINIIGRQAPKETLKRWRRIVRKKGLRGLSEVRGKNSLNKKIKLKYLTDTDKIKYLEAEIAYLKQENDFLAKLRAKRTE